MEFTAEQDRNGNGIIDDDELTEEQLTDLKIAKNGQKDLLKVFYFIYTFTFLFLIAKFLAFFFFNVNIDIDLSKLALALNIFIVFVGISEGVRSFGKTATEKERAPVPAFKLRYLFGYLISFAALTLSVVAAEFIIKSFKVIEEGMVYPDFKANSFMDGLVSNVVSYLVARFGDKVAEHIDLTAFKIFKK